ncbi:MAG: hypothetical protein H6660_18730 [Ardenticatenaceae bacterium]|nr:hypothetical protein [Ardenticatenaceae bacterium]
MAAADEMRVCPQCRSRLVFAPDGRGMLCERCGYRHVVERPLPAAIELGQAQKLLPFGGTTDGQKITNLRITLRQGIGAVKEKNRDEAFSHLERVILSGDADDKMRAEAWLWLSQVYEEIADKRECLEQVLSLDPTHGSARRGIAILDGRLDPDEIVDPNRVRAVQPEEPQTAQAEQFTCPRCSSRMNYTPDGGALRCEFCGHEQALNEDETETVQAEFGIGGMEQDFIAGLARASGHLQPVAVRVLQCQGCGVEFVLAPQTISLTCPYCQHVYVTETAETREILPAQALIPFATSEDDVKRLLRDWFKSQKVSRVKLSPLIGLYLPVWTFDFSGEIQWKGFVRQGDDWVARSGYGHILEDDYLQPAVNKPSKYLQRSLADFDMNGLVAYDGRYLADWPAERYQLALADASIAARRTLVQRLRRDPYRLTGGEQVRDLTFNTSGLTILSYKLVLLPLWMAHYEIEDRRYDLFINGQTGQVRGEKQEGVVGKLVSWFKGDA